MMSITKSSCTHVRNRLRAQTYIFISLCGLIVLSIFVPDPGRFPQGTSAPISIYLDHQSCAPLPVAYAVSNNRRRINRAEGSNYRKAVSLRHAGISSGISQCFISTPAEFLITSVASTASLKNFQDFQQACQLLDIPPPI